ncbi:hypothetical protein PPSIR1_02653 [Plesiocystis pacifica SIR-1]|uniref:SbsA Ig-like domain-containing protein n=1 Tax=Plesiocystis pacifica SIR-1 TaxID=391625 RepID=A6GKE7_9BACT|nr:hypothetical protein PPSIR1_02653 [Plesiocystis pacifica SIR-1]
MLGTAACTDDGGGADEIGATEDSGTEEVATFDGTETETDSESSTETDSESSTETETNSESSTETETNSESSTETETETGTETDTGTETETDTGTESTETESTDTGETGMANVAPTVVATTPAAATAGVAPDVDLSVEFSEPMDPATITTNVGADTSCSGTLQLSADDFATCVPMAGAPTSGDATTFALSPAQPLASATGYALRVLGTVTDAEGLAMGPDYADEPFVVRYFHTIVIDGANDFGADETFTSSTLGHTGYVAWDADYLYLGMSSPDLMGDDPLEWFVAYLGGAPGSSSGVLYNTQEPALPFEARWHLRWKASDDFGSGLEFVGANWVDAGFGPSVGSEDVAASGAFLELRVAWTDLDDPELIAVHLGMLREQAFNEASWAAVPESSYVDGYDPDCAAYFEFDRLASTLPMDYEPL